MYRDQKFLSVWENINKEEKRKAVLTVIKRLVTKDDYEKDRIRSFVRFLERDFKEE